MSGLRPGDIVIALELVLAGGNRLSDIAAGTCRSVGEVHNALRRLESSRLLKPGTRQIYTDPLFSFLRWGVPVAFPAKIGGLTPGVPTARLGIVVSPGTDSVGQADAANGPLLAGEFVWPSRSGTSRGQALTPLYPAAARLVSANPRLYTALTLVDLLRVGGLREQSAAMDAIVRHLTPAQPTPP